MRIIFVLMGLFIAMPILAHDPLDLATDAEKRVALGALDDFLTGAFVEVLGEEETLARDFEYVGKGGKRFFVDATQIATALMKSASAAAVPTRQITETDKVKETKRDWLVRKLKGLKPLPVRLTGAALELATQHGILPTAFVVITWVPFTFITEFLESLVMGPAHVFCHASQVAYFSAIGFVLLQGKLAVDVILTRGTSTGIGGRLKRVFSSRQAEKHFRKSLNTILVESVPLVAHQGDYDKHLLASEDVISEILADSSFWADAYQRARKTERLVAFKPVAGSDLPRDVSLLFADTELEKRVQTGYEIYSALLTFADVTRKKLRLGYELGKLPASTYLARKAALGKWMNALDQFRRGIWFAVGEADPALLHLNRVWANRSYFTLLATLETLSKFDAKAHDLKKQNDSLDVIWQFRRGEILDLPCQAHLTEAG